MFRRRPSRKRNLVLIVAGLIIAGLLFIWLAMPRIIQSQAQKFVAEKTGHRLVMQRPEINPFTNTLRLSGLRLSEPDGKPLLAFRELVVNLSVASIFRRAFVFDDIRLDGFEAMAVLQPDGRNNWSALLDALTSKEKSADAALPRFDIQHFALTGARLDFTDKQAEPAFITHIEPINLELADISTLPDDQGTYKITAHTESGVRIDWQGAIDLEPPVMSGRINIDNVSLPRLATYVREVLPVAPPDGIAAVSANYRLAYAGGRTALNLEHIAAKITGLKLRGKQDTGPSVAIDTIEAQEGRFDLATDTFALDTLSLVNSKLDLERGGDSKALELDSVVLQNARVDIGSHQAIVGNITCKDGRARIARDTQGRIDILQAMQQAVAASAPASRETANPADAKAEPPWHYRLEKFQLSGFGAAFRDEAVAPAAELDLEDIALEAEGFSNEQKAATPLKVSFKVKQGGSFEATGKVVPEGPTADIQVKLAALDLTPAQPYLSAFANLKLVQGKLSSEGRASYDAKGGSYRGSFAVRDLRLNEAASGNRFLAWKYLGSRTLAVTPAKLDIGELAVNGLDTNLVIYKDKSVSFKNILVQPAKAAATKHPDAPAAAKPTPPFQVDIDRVRISKSAMDFADLSLALPFGTRIHDLHGVISGISSRPGATGQLELDGQVDDYGLARAVGEVDLFDPTGFMDLKVVFKNIEMTRLTPYSATFAGRKITSGKLSLDLDYKIKKRQLQGENQVIMDQLTLGEKIDSPDATNLPLDLAIAVLQDADGRIDLGLPVSGSLDDPQFSYGRIIWKAIVNVLTRIVTAPFRALAALFGSDVKFEDIAFEAGDAQLTPPERENLVRLAGILLKRPGLSLTLQGAYAETDRVALQDLQLRRAMAKQAGLQVEADSDPGPISTRQPRIQSALEKLYADRFGKDELGSLKQGFREANPGQLEESAAGKLISRLSGLFHKQKKLNEQEVGKLKGGDFYTILFERLRSAIEVGDERLQALATARGETAAMALKAAGVPAERMTLLAAEKVDAAGRDVPLKLSLGTAAKTPAPAASVPAAN